jgi:hypothetical protein
MPAPVLPKRWIVERTLRNDGCAFIRLAMMRIMLRRLAENASP